MYFEQSQYRFHERLPQSSVSDTKPNQTVHLSVLVKQLMQGQSLNVGLALTSTPDATLDSPDLSKLDLKHVTVHDIERLIPVDNSVSATPPSGYTEVTQSTDTTDIP